MKLLVSSSHLFKNQSLLHRSLVSLPLLRMSSYLKASGSRFVQIDALPDSDTNKLNLVIPFEGKTLNVQVNMENDAMTHIRDQVQNFDKENVKKVKFMTLDGAIIPDIEKL